MMFQLEKLLPLFFSVLGVITFFITFKIKLERDTKRQNEKSEAYLTQEFNALFTRKKEIPESLFIKIPLKDIPLIKDPECKLLYDQLMLYGDNKMSNLKGYTNLDLKQLYGISQFDNLVQYEKNYLTFMDILVKYGSILYEKAFIYEAKSVLEGALSYKCDLSKCYFILSDIYFKENKPDLLENLARVAQQNMNDSHYLTKVLQKIESVKQDID